MLRRRARGPLADNAERLPWTQAGCVLLSAAARGNGSSDTAGGHLAIGLPLACAPRQASRSSLRQLCLCIGCIPRRFLFSMAARTVSGLALVRTAMLLRSPPLSTHVLTPFGRHESVAHRQDVVVVPLWIAVVDHDGQREEEVQ